MKFKMFHSLLRKELLLLFRAQNGLISMVSLILSFVYIFHFVFEKDFFLERNTIAGIRWSLIYLLSFIYISQSSWEEREGGADRIGSGMISGTYIYLAKTLSSFSALTLSSLVLNLACIFLFEKSSMSFNEFIMQYALLFPGMLSVAAIGVCISRISEATRLKEIIIPVLQIPLS
ncbi:MAG TPA: heme exporter protein CcmB, partial [Leptospiraceae bacterium]|nr:heme exporter protein CcmB [Leptospiraceae bacterium]